LKLISANAYFPTGHTAIVRYMDVESTTATINVGLSEVTATFADLGIPISGATPALPYIFFVDTNGVRHLACQDPSTSGFQKDVTVDTPNSTSGVQCSFAGGCTFEVAASGLAASLKADDQNKITICGETCVFQEALSDDTKATCTLPPLKTTYSASNYGLMNSGVLTPSDFTASNTDPV
jgi:hypothetical protein